MQSAWERQTHTEPWQATKSAFPVMFSIHVAPHRDRDSIHLSDHSVVTRSRTGELFGFLVFPSREHCHFCSLYILECTSYSLSSNSSKLTYNCRVGNFNRNSDSAEPLKQSFGCGTELAWPSLEAQAPLPNSVPILAHNATRES